MITAGSLSRSIFLTSKPQIPRMRKESTDQRGELGTRSSRISEIKMSLSMVYLPATVPEILGPVCISTIQMPLIDLKIGVTSEVLSLDHLFVWDLALS